MMNNRHLPDSHQNFWEIASIQVASIGIPGMVLGWQIAKAYGRGNAIGAICIGNLILWFIGLIIISMSVRNRTDAVTNVRQHLGKNSAWFAAILIMVAYLFWVSSQIQSSVNALENALRIHPHVTGETAVRIGAAFGLFGSLLAIGGMRMVRWLNVFCLPLFIGFQIFLIIISDHSPSIDNLWGVSIPAITSIILFRIATILLLPTFFRHSRSLTDSYLSLTIIAVLISFFQISSILIGFDDLLSTSQITNTFFLFSTVAFIALLTICTIIFNIYYASIILEALVPNFEGFKEYVIIGLSGAATYLFIQISPPIIFLRNLTTDFIAMLSVALSTTYFVQLIVKRRPISFGKLVGSVSWIIGCLSITILNIQNNESNIMNLYISIGVSILFCTCVLFMEETVWALRKFFRKTK